MRTYRKRLIKILIFGLNFSLYLLGRKVQCFQLLWQLIKFIYLFLLFSPISSVFFSGLFPVIAQAEDCLRRERDRVSHYLHSSTEQKLVEVSLFFFYIYFFGWLEMYSFFSSCYLFECTIAAEVIRCMLMIILECIVRESCTYIFDTWTIVNKELQRLLSIQSTCYVCFLLI